MRYGAKILFEDVSTAFLSGPPLRADRSERRRQVDVHEDSDRRTGAAERQRRAAETLGVLSQDQFAFDEFRVIDTVIMGNRPLWAALAERDAPLRKPELTDEDGMRLGELEGIVGEEDGYTAESDAAVLLDGLDIPESLHERKMSELQGGQKVRVLLAQALFGEPAGAAAGRAHQPPGSRIDPLAAELPDATIRAL